MRDTGHGNFGVEPGQVAFQNIANNVLSYLHDRPVSVLDRNFYAAGRRSRLCNPDNVAKGKFTLSVKENGNIFVAGGTSVRVKIKNPDIVRTAGRVDLSKYRFDHGEIFEISGKKLRSNRFDPRASLVFVDPFDTVELAD